MNDPSTPLPAADPPALAPRGDVALAAGAIAAARYADDDGAIDAQSSLPADHPPWQRDVLAISARARAALALLRPVAVRVVTFWDHLVRSVSVGNGRTLEVDPSGCYRLR